MKYLKSLDIESLNSAEADFGKITVFKNDVLIPFCNLYVMENTKDDSLKGHIKNYLDAGYLI